MFRESFSKGICQDSFPGYSRDRYQAGFGGSTERPGACRPSAGHWEQAQERELRSKGNIMKFTEGAFKDWGYALAKREFRTQVVTGA